MKIVRKLIAGGPGRPTRLHTERGELVPLSELLRLPKAVIDWSAGKLKESRADEPWWPVPVIPIIAKHLNSDSTVLEFGAGSSTIWLAQRSKSVVSIEHNPLWHSKVVEQLRKRGLVNATVQLVSEQDYCDLSWAGNEKFDLIIVDGLFRWKCVEAALPHIRAGGILYLDNSDADKDLKLYPATGMTQLAQSLLEKYAMAHPSAKLTRHVGLINGELHAGEGMILKIGE